MALTVTTWNVQNFHKGDAVLSDNVDDIAGARAALGSDVVALPMILDLVALEDLARKLGSDHVAAHPDGRGNRVAFLTRDPLAHPIQQIDQWQSQESVEVQRFNDGGNVETADQFRRPARDKEPADGSWRGFFCAMG